MAKVFERGEGRYTYRVFGRRVVWAPLWWVAVVLLGVAIFRLFVIPVHVTNNGGETVYECGGAAFGSTAHRLGASGSERIEASEYGERRCARERTVETERGMAFAAVALLPFWLGIRQVRGSWVPWQHVAAATCVGVSMMLLLGPDESSLGAECGSLLWVDVERSSNEQIEDRSCIIERPSRVGWAVFWGVLSVPFAISASRRDDHQ